MTLRYRVTDAVDLPTDARHTWAQLVQELSGAGAWWNTNNTFESRRPVGQQGTVSTMTVFPGGVGKPGPRIRFSGRTTKVVPESLLEQRYSGAFRGVGQFRIESTGPGRSRLSFTFDVEPRGWVRQLARVKDVGEEHSTATRAAFRRLAELFAQERAEVTSAPPIERIVRAADGAGLHTYDHGPRDGAPVILVHGWGSRASAWNGVRSRLVDAGRRVIALDLRGHGDSGTGTAPVSLTVLADDLRRVLRALDVEGAVCVGHSGGGLAALQLAHHEPDLVGGLVLLGTAAQDSGAAPPEVALMGSPLLTAALRRPRFAHRILSATMGPDRRIAARDQIAADLADTPSGVRAAYFRATQHVDLTAQCAQLQLPVVVARGDEDKVVGGAGVEQTAQLLGTSVRVVPFAGHSLPLEEPEVVAEAVEEVLSRIV
ncbi:alpha/beta fold hydrolase [Flexivirga meconopsidis]|uniref:alpha/beta fold hydrolase n=1 Tax=Flexivirga meconopsidis TaxID=2977121 RepID=UPI0022406B86|nr:alpha/beta hydrolase [Flexivirga meconopsidis]